jgi:hypothetical protein
VRTNSAIRELDDPADGSRDVHLLGEAANPAATRSRRAGGRRPTPEALSAKADSSGDVSYLEPGARIRSSDDF